LHAWQPQYAAARSELRTADTHRERAAPGALRVELFLRIRRQQLRVGLCARRCEECLMAALPTLYLQGFAFWSSRLPGWDVARAVIRGERAAPEAPAPRPAPTLLAPTERRRAPDTVA